jgi:serine/threonine protein kinase
MLGKTLNNRYEIQQILSNKQGKKTLLGFDKLTQTWVIIKIIIFDQGIEWQDLKLFEREANTLKELDHPSIPRYLDYFEVDLPDVKGFALVQTNIQAISLEEHFKNGRLFSEDETINLAKQLLEILIYLHEKLPPIIHRDLKPSNILLTNRSGNSPGQVYLIDFGSVQNEVLKIGNTNTIVGTYGYMPLEQFGGRTVPASDLYSLGATLAYLITGTNPADLPLKNGQIDLDNLNNISLVTKKWLAQMLAPEVGKRFQTAKLALSALDDLNHFSEITIIKKPKSSQIQLTKNMQEIKIFIPPFGFDPSLICIGCFAIGWNSLIFSWTLGLSSAPFPMNIPFLLFSLPFWAAGLSLAYQVLFPLFGKTYLIINQNTISLTQEIFNFCYSITKPAPRDEIYRLVFTPKHYAKDSDGDRTEVLAKLIIYAGRNEYKLERITTEEELQWLAQELSEWLGIPIINLINPNAK